MAITLNDNDGIVNYTLSLVNTDGKRLITEGIAAEAIIVDSSSISLNGVSIDQRLEVIDTHDQVGSESNESVDADPEPQAPIKPRTAPEVGKNPYVDRGELGCGQKFVTSYNDEFYEFEREYSDGRLILNVKDEDGNLASIYLTYRERVEMATRLLSVTEEGILVSNGASSFVVDKNVSDEEVPRGIGAAVFMLHAHLEDLKHQERVEAYEAEHAKWEQRQAEKTVGKNEAEALHELVVREFIERDPDSEDFLRSLEDGSGVKASYPITYSHRQREILNRLKDCELTAIQQLANVLDDEKKANTPEDDALDALALSRINAGRGRPNAYSLEEAKRTFTYTFPDYVTDCRERAEELGVTAVQYANVHGIKFPAA